MNKTFINYDPLRFFSVTMDFNFDKEECKTIVKNSITNLDDNLFDYCFTIFNSRDIDILKLHHHIGTEPDYGHIVNTLYTKFQEHDDFSTHPLFVITYHCMLRLCAMIDNTKCRLILKYCMQIESVTRQKLYYDLQKSKEHTKQMEKILIERAYDEKPRNEIVYIAKELSQLTTNIHKIGITDDTKKRESSLNTGNSHGISIIFEKKVTNKLLVEQIVHKLLTKYHFSKEFYSNNECYSKSLIHIVGEFVSTLDSSRENIHHEDLVAKIIENISKPINTKEQQDGLQIERNPLYKFLIEKTRYKEGNVVMIKTFKELFGKYINKKIRNLDNGTFYQVNPNYFIERIKVCKHCYNPSRKGCCSKYSQNDRTHRVCVHNIEVIE
jgi:hypothetical protein